MTHLLPIASTVITVFRELQHALAVTVTYMKCWGLRALSLSAVTKVSVGQKGSFKHQTPNILYMMLWAFI